MVAGHRSTEPGASRALAALGLRPVLDLGLRLGEGSGAVLALPVIQAAARVLRDVATFDSAGVSGKKELRHARGDCSPRRNSMNTSVTSARETPVYPLSLRMDGRLAVVIGAGPVAVRRVAGLRAAGADVLVVAPDITPSLADLAARGLVRMRRGNYAASDLDGAWLVLACTDQPAVNAMIAGDAERLRLWCVRADDAMESAAWVPAVGRAGAVTVAVNAGRDPRRAAAVRDQCLRVAGETSAAPLRFGDNAEMREGEKGEGQERRGRVSIVGGGPGDPGLITAAGLDRLRHADVVVTDRLVAPQLLAELPDGVHVIDAAKVPRGPAMRQEDINAALVEHARAGRAVVRLKGGDPYVFGRGREEVDACLAAGVPVDVIPGVTSAISVPAAAGIPVTHRGLTQGFTVVSGHVSPDDPRSTVNWTALAQGGTTLVLLMAVEHLAEIADALAAGGLAAETPAACVADGWTAHQRVVAAPLADLARIMSDQHITNPAVIVIGDTAEYAAAGKEGDRHEPLAGGSPVARYGRLARPSARDRVLVLGGARSGKSATAERFLAPHSEVEYVATGTLPDEQDREWAARVAEHRHRRPPHWHTNETLDLDQVLKSEDPAPVLIDCLSLWLARVMDECDAWAVDGDGFQEVTVRLDRLVRSWRATSRLVVAVTNEVGCGIVPATASGSRYRDALGRLNAAIAANCDEVWFCTAGLPRRLR
jgi:uroporphyrin-III C-methyltransferase/precorrin-2 dehydrogenase/sirohydrochlorin ferrochelatase